MCSSLYFSDPVWSHYIHHIWQLTSPFIQSQDNGGPCKQEINRFWLYFSSTPFHVNFEVQNNQTYKTSLRVEERLHKDFWCFPRPNFDAWEKSIFEIIFSLSPSPPPLAEEDQQRVQGGLDGLQGNCVRGSGGREARGDSTFYFYCFCTMGQRPVLIPRRICIEDQSEDCLVTALLELFKTRFYCTCHLSTSITASGLSVTLVQGNCRDVDFFIWAIQCS